MRSWRPGLRSGPYVTVCACLGFEPECGQTYVLYLSSEEIPEAKTEMKKKKKKMTYRHFSRHGLV